MSNWLSRFVDHNRNFAGNALKNISPFLALTPLGIPASLAAGALGRGMQKGANFGSIVKSGVSNAALGAGVQGGAAALHSAFAPSSSAAGAVYGGGSGAGAAENLSGLGASGPAFAQNAASAGAAGGGTGAASLTSKIGGMLGKGASFVEAHPKTLEMGLSSFDPMKNAETERIRLQNQMDQDDMDRRKRRDAALAPLMQAFMGQFQQMQGNPYPIAKNPYGGG